MVWKKKRGNGVGSRLHLCKIFMSTYWEVLTQRQLDVHLKWIQRLESCLAFKILSIWKPNFGLDPNCLPPDQQVEMKHSEDISKLFNRGDSFFHRSWALSMCSSIFFRLGTLSGYLDGVVTLTMTKQGITLRSTISGWPNKNNLNLQILPVVIAQFCIHLWLYGIEPKRGTNFQWYFSNKQLLYLHIFHNLRKSDFLS